MILGILGILWLIISELWDVGILKFVIAFGHFGNALFAFIAGVLFAVICGQLNVAGEAAAAAAFAFLLMIASIGAGLFSWQAGGGGTAN